MPNESVKVRLLPLRPDVQDRVCMGKSRIYDLIKSGDFPQPVKLGRRIAFVEAEVDEWIAARVAERTKTA